MKEKRYSKGCEWQARTAWDPDAGRKVSLSPGQADHSCHPPHTLRSSYRLMGLEASNTHTRQTGTHTWGAPNAFPYYTSDLASLEIHSQYIVGDSFLFFFPLPSSPFPVPPSWAGRSSHYLKTKWQRGWAIRTEIRTQLWRTRKRGEWR